MCDEPSREMFEEVGRLCSAWAFLEKMTEITVWGVLDTDERLGPIITWRLDLRGRWELLIRHAPKKHDAEGMEALRAIQKVVVDATRDRNIVVHGLIEAWGKPKPEGGIEYGRQPCWVVFRGAEAGKNFPISTDAVRIVRNNVQMIANRMQLFNAAHGYVDKSARKHPGPAEEGWPKPLE